MKDERQSDRNMILKDETEHLEQETKWQKTEKRPRTDNNKNLTNDKKTKDLEMTKDPFASSTRLWNIPTDLN